MTPVVVTQTTSNTQEASNYKAVTQTSKTASSKRTVAVSNKTAEKSTTDINKSYTTNIASNANLASVVGVGGALPNTLIGWVLIFILVFVVVLLAHKIYKSNEERKLIEEAKMKALKNTA